MLLDDFLPFFMHEFQGCPDVIAKLAVLGATMDFCGATNAWNEVQDPFTLIDNQNIYDIDVPTDAQVVTVMELWSPTKELVSKTMAEISRILPNWQEATGSRPVWFNSAPGSGEIQVFPIPLNALRLQITPRISYKPVLTATTIPDVVVNDFHEALIYGTKGRLRTQGGKSWSNPQLGQLDLQAFDNMKVDARITISKDRVPGTTNAQPMAPFGG